MNHPFSGPNEKKRKKIVQSTGNAQASEIKYIYFKQMSEIILLDKVSQDKKGQSAVFSPF